MSYQIEFGQITADLILMYCIECLLKPLLPPKQWFVLTLLADTIYFNFDNFESSNWLTHRPTFGGEFHLIIIGKRSQFGAMTIS